MQFTKETEWHLKKAPARNIPPASSEKERNEKLLVPERVPILL